MPKIKKNKSPAILSKTPDFALIEKSILAPHFSEKASKNEGLHKYTIRINKKVNKKTVKDIIEKTYGVKVIKVNITKNPSKKKWTQRGTKRIARKYIKKAVLTVETKKKLDLTKL